MQSYLRRLLNRLHKSSVQNSAYLEKKKENTEIKFLSQLYKLKVQFKTFMSKISTKILNSIIVLCLFYLLTYFFRESIFLAQLNQLLSVFLK